MLRHIAVTEMTCISHWKQPNLKMYEYCNAMCLAFNFGKKNCGVIIWDLALMAGSHGRWARTLLPLGDLPLWDADDPCVWKFQNCIYLALGHDIFCYFDIMWRLSILYLSVTKAAISENYELPNTNHTYLFNGKFPQIPNLCFLVVTVARFLSGSEISLWGFAYQCLVLSVFLERPTKPLKRPFCVDL